MAQDVTQTLLSGLIDYAGLFPPASESMHDAVRHYQEYLAAPQSWILGRLIIPLDRLDGFRRELGGVSIPPSPWRVSCLWPATALESSTTIANSCELMRGCVAQANLGGMRKIVIDTVEVPCNAADGIRRLAEHLPESLRGFVEIAIAPVSEPCLEALHQSERLAAKIRTGGVTPQAIPPVERLAEFFQAAAVLHLPFKCTAGLHHPLPADRPLTYQQDAPVGTMQGFWNVAMATGLLLSGAIDQHVARELLRDQDAASFGVTSDELTWREFRLSHADIPILRQHGFTSFGSCSFSEPIEDLRQLGWLPDSAILLQADIGRP